CVIDEQVARQLFLFDDPLGKDVRIQGGYYRVVGITATEDVTDSAGAMGNIYIPITTSKVNFTELTYSFSGGKGSLEKIELQKIIIKVDSAEQVLPMRDVVDALLSRLHTEQDYRIVVPLELLKQAAATRRIFSIVLGSIAAISLLVGGIGIMNIMLATVSERTREIGIRRALGARKRDIIIQFLSETLILTLAGGLLGIVLGSFIPFMVTYFGNMPTVITGFSLILSFGISGMIGITFGLYPAYRAANMDPIESLRHE
ncbi:MAG: ABC transporter permease, partial [Planctomycetota bacterium]